MTRIEKVISDLSEMFEFYEKIKEHKKEKARSEKSRLTDGTAEKGHQKASEIQSKYEFMDKQRGFCPTQTSRNGR